MLLLHLWVIFEIVIEKKRSMLILLLNCSKFQARFHSPLIFGRMASRRTVAQRGGGATPVSGSAHVADPSGLPGSGGWREQVCMQNPHCSSWLFGLEPRDTCEFYFLLSSMMPFDLISDEYSCPACHLFCCSSEQLAIMHALGGRPRDSLLAC